jgi:hypothetical protein
MTEIEWTPGRWDRIKPGDRVKLVHNDGEQAIIGDAANNYSAEQPSFTNLGGSYTGILAFHSDQSPWALFVPAKPALPTEPGVYLDFEGDAWLLTQGGSWRIAASGMEAAPITSLLKPGLYVPFTRLEPVAETAKRMCDRLFTEFEESTRSYAEDVEFVAAEFGVTGELGE